MKITLYTISDCQFSQQEKNYLLSKNLPYEEKNLESNREFLTEMLALSNNFAGTPVTKIEKDDGQIIVLKGFTVEEFDKAFGFQTAVTSVQAPVQQPVPQIAQPVMPVPVIPVAAAPIIPQVESTPTTAIPQEPIQPQYVAPVEPVSVQPQTYAPQPVQMDSAPAVPAFNTEPPIATQPIQSAPVEAQIPQPQYVPPSVEPMAQPMQAAPAQDQALNDILSSLQSKVEDNQNAPQAQAAFPPVNNPSGMN